MFYGPDPRNLGVAGRALISNSLLASLYGVDCALVENLTVCMSPYFLNVFIFMFGKEFLVFGAALINQILQIGHSSNFAFVIVFVTWVV